MFSSLFSRDLSRPVVAPPSSSTTAEVVVKKVRDVFKNATDSQGREVMRLKRLLDTMEIEVVAVIERQLQVQTVEPGAAPRAVEVNRFGPVPLRRNVTVCPFLAEPFDVEAFLRDTLDSLDGAEALCELSMTRSSTSKYKRSSTSSAPSAPPPTPTTETSEEAAASASDGEDEGEGEMEGDSGEEDDGDEEMDDDSDGDEDLVDAPLQLNLSIPASLSSFAQASVMVEWGDGGRPNTVRSCDVIA